MKALFYQFKKKKFFLTDTPIPKLKNGWALVKIKYSALCGTDFHIIQGILKDKAYNSQEIILGHAFSGIIEKIGKNKLGLKPGQKIFGIDFVPCTFCKQCKQKKENLCEFRKIIGMEIAGTHAQYSLLPIQAVKKLPPFINLIEGCLLTDVLATALHAVKISLPQKNQKVMIWGMGPLGITIGLILERVYKIKKIFFYEPSVFRKKLAQKILKSAHFLSFRSKKFENIFDISYEVSGSPKALAQTLFKTKRGGSIVIVGVHDHLFTLPTTKIVSREIKLLGSFTYNFKDLSEAINLIKNKKISLKPLITHIFPFSKAIDAYKKFSQKKTGAVVLKIDN